MDVKRKKINTTILELSNISNILEQTEPAIKDVDLKKQERKSLKELQENKDLVKRNPDKGGIILLMENDYYCNILIMKLNLSSGQCSSLPHSNKEISTQKVVSI